MPTEANEAPAIIVSGQRISYFEGSHAPWKGAAQEAKIILGLATPDEQTQPTGSVLGQLFVDANIKPEEVKKLRRYVDFACLRSRKSENTDDLKALENANFLLSDTLAWMQTRDLPKRPEESVIHSSDVFQKTPHQRNPGRRYNPNGFNPEDK